MKKLKSLTIIFVLLSFYSVDAQQVVKKDTIKGTVLTETMDARINTILTDLEEKCAKNKEAEIIPTSPKSEISVKPKSTAEICRDNPKLWGFKIQIAVVKSNDEANKVKTYFRTRFPYIKVEVDAALRPNYKILVGSYFSKQSAGSDLAKIKNEFPSAIPVEYRVFCVEAK